MGSKSPLPEDLPLSTSPNLTLLHPTPEERARTASLTHPLWGPALSPEAYVEREKYLTTVPLAKDGGITHWILTDASLPPNERPIFSTVESIRRRALVCRCHHRPAEDGGGGRGTGRTGTGEVEDGVTHGIGSVFTADAFRGRGYAGRMMTELGKKLRAWQADWTGSHNGAIGKEDAKAANGGSTAGQEVMDAGFPNEAPKVPFSVLYSDIGKTFYAKRGWAPFESTHLSFSPLNTEVYKGTVKSDQEWDAVVLSDGIVTPLGYDDLPELCATDEKLLRSRLRRTAMTRNRTCVALLPDLDTMLWHLMREDFMTSKIFSSTPTVRGAICGELMDRGGRGRVWAIWTRGYYGGLHKMDGNALHILRFVAEEQGGVADDAQTLYLAKAVRAILDLARAEAKEWRSADVQIWNPEPWLRRACDGAQMEYNFVEREEESIPSLMWYGEGTAADVDWVYNEKFGWC